MKNKINSNFKRSIIVVIATILLSSCAIGSSVIKDEKIFTVGIKNDILSLDPSLHNDIISTYITNAVYSTLFIINEKGEVEPSIAKNYEYITETRLKIEIHKGIKFHNGESLTADDVVATLNRSSKSEKVESYLSSIKRIRKIDDYALLIETKYGFAPLLGKLTHSSTAILSKKDIDSNEVDSINGTGPFKFVERVENDYILLERNNEYFQKDKISELEKIEFKVISDEDEIERQFKEGIIDMATALPKDRYKDIEEIVELEGAITETYLLLNLEKEPFNDSNFRKAIEHSLNKDAIAIMSTNGYGKESYSIVPDNVIGYLEWDNEVYTYNKEEAEKYLKLSEYNKNDKLTMFISGSENKIIGSLIKDSLGEIGINIVLEEIEFKELVEVTKTDKYDIAILNWQTFGEPDNYFYPLLHSNNIGNSNRVRLSNEIIDGLIEEGRSVIEINSRGKIYRTINEMVIEENFMIPLYTKKNFIVGYKPYNYKGVYYKDGSLRLNNIRLINN